MGMCTRLTRAEDAALAELLYKKLWFESALARSLAATAGLYKYKPSIPVRYDKDYRSALLSILDTVYRPFYDKLLEQVHSTIYSLANRYRYIEYFLDTPLSNITALALVAHPPDCTWRPAVVKPSTWIATYFLPIRTGENYVIRNIRRLFFFAKNSLALRKILANDYLPRIKQLYEAKTEQYIRQGRNKLHARRLALRDALRVFIGNTWLIATLEAYEKHVIDECDIVLPYEAAENPDKFLAGVIQPYEAVKPSAREKWALTHYKWGRLLILYSRCTDRERMEREKESRGQVQNNEARGHTRS